MADKKYDEILKELVDEKKKLNRTCPLCKSSNTSVEPVEVNKENNFVETSDNKVLDRLVYLRVC